MLTWPHWFTKSRIEL